MKKVLLFLLMPLALSAMQDPCTALNAHNNAMQEPAVDQQKECALKTLNLISGLLLANHAHDQFKKYWEPAKELLNGGYQNLWRAENFKISASIASKLAETKALEAARILTHSAMQTGVKSTLIPEALQSHTFQLSQEWRNALRNQELIEDFEKELFGNSPE